MIQRPRHSWLDAEPIGKRAAVVEERSPATAGVAPPVPPTPVDDAAPWLARPKSEPAAAAPPSAGDGPAIAASAVNEIEGQDGPAPAADLKLRLKRAGPAAEQPLADDVGFDGSLGEGYTPDPAREGAQFTALFVLVRGREGAPMPEIPVPHPSPGLAGETLALQATSVARNAKGFDAMAEGRFVSYLRVSTARQGASGLGLEAQRKSVADFLAGGRWSLMREVVEVESGKRTDRPKLAEAMALCRIHGATLVIAKIDRLSRNAAFLLSLRDAGVDFVAADMPNANRLTVGIMAMVAEAERDAISARTKAALAAKAEWYRKATPEQLAALQEQGKATRLGGARPNSRQIHQQGAPAGLAARQAKAAGRAADLAPVIADLQTEGVTSLAKLAAALTERGIPTSRGAERWSASQVSRLMRAAGSAAV